MAASALSPFLQEDSGFLNVPEVFQSPSSDVRTFASGMNSAPGEQALALLINGNPARVHFLFSLEGTIGGLYS